ncbi:phage head-tail connector protein [Blastomonas sp. AAP53]|uniref:head-tail connector protein n=1 Tax=Blastomonas sp. AAP53 TaxID=1248760 RepID=UPI00030B5759|nr:phage head-tail connector protein [Blastomonas sp. AAP53]
MGGITSEPAAIAPLALAEAKAFLNVTRDGDDAVLTGHLRSAAGLCEQFIGQSLLVREYRETLPVARAWQRLGARPVHAITSVSGINAAGERFALASDAFAIDISADGSGRVRVLRPGSASRIEVRYDAGLAAHWGDLPEPLRQGIIRLAAHVHLARDTGDAAPPAMISALWRPWRVVRL